MIRSNVSSKDISKQRHKHKHKHLDTSSFSSMVAVLVWGNMSTSLVRPLLKEIIMTYNETVEANVSAISVTREHRECWLPASVAQFFNRRGAGLGDVTSQNILYVASASMAEDAFGILGENVRDIPIVDTRPDQDQPKEYYYGYEMSSLTGKTIYRISCRGTYHVFKNTADYPNFWHYWKCEKYTQLSLQGLGLLEGDVPAFFYSDIVPAGASIRGEAIPD